MTDIRTHAPKDAETAAAAASEREQSNLRLISDSSLFDADWYVSKHPEAAGSGLSPALHYLRIGAAQGWAPSPGFDGADYLARYKDIAAIGMNPLVHYLAFGRKESRKIIPADPEEIQVRLIASSEFFDAGWYKATYPEAARSPLPPERYFLRHGREKGHNPGPLFDAAEYIATYADVASSKINPLLHYLQFGKFEGRTVSAVQSKPKPAARKTESSRRSSARQAKAAVAEPPAKSSSAPLVADRPAADDEESREAANAVLIRDSGLFDAVWYTRNHPEAESSGLAPEVHYLRHGGPKGWAPSPAFDAAYYLAKNADVRETAINPLIHYVLFGKAENRKTRPWDEAEVTLRLVEESGFYDEAWYVATYPDVLKSKLTPLKHFIKHGREKNHNPGPAFHAAAYVEANQDVAASKANPLVHYLKTGRAEGRAITAVPASQPPPAGKPAGAASHVEAAVAALPATPPTPQDFAADLELIETTPFFDAAWYRSRYPEVARAGIPPAEHYLRHGGAEMRQPSLFFDPQYYVIEQSPEIQQTGINPLLHYLKVGKPLGRSPRALFEGLPADGPFKPLSPVDWPLAAAGEPRPPAEPAWTRQDELVRSPGEGSLYAGETLIACAQNAALLDEARDRLSAFGILCGIDGFTVLSGGRHGPLSLGDADPSACTSLGSAFAYGPGKLTDAWHAADRTLRLRLGDEGAASHAPLVLRAFQCRTADQRDPVLCCEALLANTAPAFVDVALVNPFMPLLLVLSDSHGHAAGIGLLPFPALCRGGLHHAELVGASQLSHPMDRLRTLSDAHLRALMAQLRDGQRRLVASIAVDLRNAMGTEPVFDADFVAWLSRVFGVTVSAAAAAVGRTPGENHLESVLEGLPRPQAANRDGQFSLNLPPDAVPTLAALTAPAIRGDVREHAGSYFVADSLSARPRLSVQMPEHSENLVGLQPAWAPLAFPMLRPLAGAGMASGHAHESLPHLAIRFPAPTETNRASVLMPVAPDAPVSILPASESRESIDIVVRTGDPKRLETLLRSVTQQRGAAIGLVRADVLRGSCDAGEVQAVLNRLVPGRGIVNILDRHCPIGPATLLAASSSDCTLVAEESIILHDPRTLETLAGMVRGGNAASAGCVVLREVGARRGTALSFESGGYFPSHVSLIAAPRLIVSLPDTRGALPNATYPVLANDPALLVLGNEAVRRTAAAGVEQTAGAPDVFGFSLAALAGGYRHLCTTALRATVLGPLPAREASDPPGVGALNPGTWQMVLGSLVILRELH